jgi:hypothetical protein
MTTISHLSAARLHRAAELQTNIEALQAELANVLGGTPSPVVAETAVAPPAAVAAPVAAETAVAPPAAAAAPVAAAPKKGQLTAAGRAKIIAASRAYWAMVRAGAKATAAKPIAAKAPAKQKGAISPAGRAKLVAIAKARWAKNKASGKSQL